MTCSTSESSEAEAVTGKLSSAALICLSHELILSDSSAEYFPVPTTGTGVGLALFLAQP